MGSTDSPPDNPPAGAPPFDRTLRYGDAVENAATLRDEAAPEMAEGATLLAPGGAPPSAAGRTGLDGLLPPGSTVRSTVLPRVEREGDEPRLVVAERRRFEPVRLLGEGGAGEVWAATDNDIDRSVAVKTMRPEIASPEALARFVEEIRTVGRLEHPNIVPIHDVGVEADGGYYFVMKHVDGETLESVIERLAAGDAATHRRYPFEARIQLFRGLLEAVAFAHSKGIVHRDIKPANVMIGSFGEVLLMDWGIAKSIRAEDAAGRDEPPRPAAPRSADGNRIFETRAGAILGTPLYMSPEQACGEPVDERSDVYSLAVLLHELLTLRHYLAGRKSLREVLDGVLEAPFRIGDFTASPHQPPVPMDLVWYVRRGMHKAPERRFRSVAAMIERLDDRSEGRIPIECHITLTKRVTAETLRFVDRHPLLATVAMATVLGGGIALLVRGLGGPG